MRKRLLTFLCLLLGMGGVIHAEKVINAETDLTSQFASLVTTQWTLSSAQVGWAAPPVTINAGFSSPQAAWERYEGSCDWTGDIMYTTVTGLTAGTYKIELYGAAAFTFGRGFGSEAFTGDLSTATSSTYSENQSITENTGVVLYATTSEGTFSKEIPIWYATNFNASGLSTIALDNVIVGSNGQIKIGMSKTSKSTNWHVVQLKGVTATVNLTEVYGKLYDEANGLKSEEMSSDALAGLNAAMVSDASFTTADQYNSAISALTAAINTAKASIADLKRVVFNGVYYIQNVASGKFFSVGHDYGTRGIVDEIGLDLTLTGNSDTKKTTFDSKISNGGDSHYLGSNLYMDSGVFDWSIEKISNDTYSIGNGTQYVGVDANDNLVMVGEPVAWKFLTRADRIAALADATETNPIDATFLVVNNSFGRNNQRAAWTVSADCTNSNLSGGNDGNRCAESYHSTFTISQTITGNPEGLYKMKAQGFYRQDDGATEAAPLFFINNKSMAVPVKTGGEGNMWAASTSFSNGSYDMEDPIECRVPEDITVGIKGTATHQWVIFDNFRLYYYGIVPPDKADMEPSLETAKELAGMSFKTEGKDALNAAIADAQTAYDNSASMSLKDFGAAVTALDNAIAAFKKVNYVPMNGVYYVQHVASGKYMAAGHNYGTRGIVDEVGLDLTLATHNATDRTVSFDTQVFNDKKHFLGSNLYTDSDVFGWIIEKTGEDTYSISNGTQYIGVDAYDNLVMVDEPVEWKFVTRADRIAALSAASENNPVNATFLIKDNNFSRGNKRIDLWSKTGFNQKNGNQDNMCAESHHTAFNVSQTISDAPSGSYKLEAQGFYRQDNNVTEDKPVFFINDDEASLSAKQGEEGNMWDASTSFSNGLYEHTLDGKAKGALKVGVKGTATNQWVIFDNFRLTYYGPIPADATLMDPVMAIAKKFVADPYKTEGKEALQEAITVAETAASYISYKTYDEFEADVKKLQAAIDAFGKANSIAKEGTFYVQHVNSGKYMAAGHDYGTRALVNETGLDLTLKANADNTVTFDTQVSNGGANHFLGSNLYMDSGAFNWWIGKYEDGTFSLCNGTQYVDIDNEGNLVFVDDPVGWQFVTPEDWQKAQMAKLDAATPENGVDATFLLKNPNFNRNDQRVSAWTVSNDCTNKNLNGGNQTNNCAESYHSTFTISQTLQGFRSGFYELKAQGFYRQDGETAEDLPVFFFNDATTSVKAREGEENSMAQASESFSEDKYNTTIGQVKVTDKFVVGVKGTAKSQWVIFDNFRLTYYGPIPAEWGQMEPVLAEAKKLAADEMKTEGKDALNAAITTAEASADNYATLSYDEFGKEVDKLQTAIEAFKKANRKRLTGAYYVQNVASGKFMSAGHNWGTQAIVDEVGLDMTLKANSKDNKVSFDSQVSNGGNSHFLNSGLYMDGTSFDWSIEKMGDNVYSISDGTKFINVDENDNLVMSEEPAAWRFVTLEERMATLEDASEDDGVDVTFLVKDYNFGRNNLRVSGWTVSDDCNKNFMTLGGPADKNIANYSGETWHTTFTISQTLSEIPIGNYGLTAQGFYRQDGEVAEAAPVFFINDERAELPVLAGEIGDKEGAAIAFGNGEYAMEEPILCTVKDGQITFGINGIASSQWVSFDNFRLIYYGLSGEDVTNPPVAKKELVYTGKPQVLIEAGSHEVGEIQYSMDKENYSTELPTATNAGSYSIWYRVVDENNVPLLSVKKMTANIAPVNATDYISMEFADADTTYTYDATAKEPEVIVKGSIKGLTAGTDYVLTYEDNVNAGTAKAIVTGLGNYKGTIVAPFDIEKAEMTLLVLADTMLVYNEEEQTVELDSVMAGELMIPADAYTVEGNVQSAVGRYTVVVTANEESNFVGALTAEFEIIGRDIADCEMTLKSYKEYFTGYERKPAVVVTRGENELTEGVDYILSYENNVNAGTAKAIVTGIGNYSGTNEQEFAIVTGDGQLTMLNDTVTISYTTSGFSVRPIKLTGDGKLTYSSSNEEVAQVNVKTGEITVNNVGETIITTIMKNTKNATSDTITCLLVVKPASEWQVTVVRTSKIYELPAFTVTSSKETLVEGRDYTLSYKNLEGREVTEAEMTAESGMYTAVVNLKGNYTGTIERNILVQLPVTDINGVKGDLDGTIRHDIGGRRVKNYRGVVIENGQKRVVKK